MIPQAAITKGTKGIWFFNRTKCHLGAVVIGTIAAAMVFGASSILKAQQVLPSQVTPQTLRPPQAEGTGDLLLLPGPDQTKTEKKPVQRRRGSNKPLETPQNPQN